MRNWNLPVLLWVAKYAPIASLPMRNWNREFLALFQLQLINCEPTYEELKHGTLSMAKRLSWLRAYLWGIETLTLTQFRLEWPCIASLPMRNWNIGGIYICPICGQNCEPTYEELKPKFSSHSWIFSVNCEPTYEELKLFYMLQWSMNNHIASLPMRNWNLYLIFLTFIAILIASLPMRNWNFWIYQQTVHPLTDCEPTYEELKLVKTIKSALKESRIASLPMRNWNRIPCDI